MLKRGSLVLSIWCGINFILAFIILCYVIVLREDSPILQVASFSEAEIASLSAKTIAALNCFTVLYNSCSLMISALTWPLIRKNLIAGQKSAFWMLVFVIGFIEVMAFFASSFIGQGRWQVNVVQSVLYLVGISLSGWSLFKGDKARIKSIGPQKNYTHPYRSKKVNEMNTNKKTARMAGFLYLIYIIISIFANLLGRSKLIVLGDAATTAGNIMASAWQFRIGFVVDLVASVLFLLTAWALYGLLKPVNKNLSLLFLLLNLGGVAVWCFSDLFLIASQLLFSGADYLKVFQADQLQALAMLSLYIYKYGFLGIAQIFFGAWLFPLGYLIFKSGFLPKILGGILMVHGVVWLMSTLQFFLFPGLIGITFVGITYISYPIGFISEFGLSLWLLIMGANEQKPALVEVG